jgi:hypothetical protein
VFGQDKLCSCTVQLMAVWFVSPWAVRTSVAVTVPVTLMCGTMFSVLLAVYLGVQ